ncbi:MAG: transposase [Bacteroidota bacterium]
MKYTRGRPLESGEKYAIVSVKGYFDRNKKEFGLTESSVQLTADALEVGVSTVKRITADFRRDPSLLDKNPAPRGRPNYAIDGSDKEKVRHFIRNANQNGQYITLSKLADFIKKNNPENKFHIATLARTLDRWGFEFGEGKRSQHLKEKDEIVVARQYYLRRMRANRRRNGKPIKPEVFLDESYVNKNHSNDFIWYFGEDGAWVQKPTGKGERLIIINAISSAGWIQGAKLVFQAKRKTGDYHGQMNAELFQKWFSERLIPNLPKPSLIILDNASYHNALSSCSPPTSHCSKEEIRKWLLGNNVICDQNCLKAELVLMLKKLAPKPIYEIDKIAEKHGHEIIRTPPYHPELQPIETCWGIVKNHVARHCDFSLENLKLQLENGFAKVTPSTCARIIIKIKKKEDCFWNDDMKFDPTE